MSKDPKFHTVAKAIRLECVQETGDVFIIFQIVDEKFKKRIKDEWMDEVEMRLINKDLVLKE